MRPLLRVQFLQAWSVNVMQAHGLFHVKDALKNCVLHFFRTQRQKRGFAFAYKINHFRV